MTQETTLTKVNEHIQFLATIEDPAIARQFISVTAGIFTIAVKEYNAISITGSKADRDKAFETVVKAGELRLLAEAKMGELIKVEQDAGRLATKGRPQKGNNVVTFLKDYGLTKMESSRAQEINEHKELIPIVVAKAIKGKDPPTRQAFSRRLKELQREQKLRENADLVTKAEPIPLDKFKTVLIDPPWDWGDEGDVNQLGRATPLYVTWPFEKLLDLPVPIKTEDNSHLYLCVTNRSLPKGFRLIEHWGFRYITILTWCKPSYGMGNYFRGQTEHILFGVKGSCELLRHDVGTWFMGKRGVEHSSKPEELYQLIETCSPGPWLYMFGRHQRPGWEVWGAGV